ncbi:MAG: polysaccharide deacetylase family protein [Ignavibacteriaceae bacterium]|nr:polysaccharide deacetylase family protein [Ignavibacteriaceae bacterium]
MLHKCPFKILSLIFLFVYNGAVIPSFAQGNYKNIPEKVVVLTFDDAIATQYTNVRPLLKKYGFGATFFICEFPPDFSDKTKYMSWEQIAELNKDGFEIANHTQSHSSVKGYGVDMEKKFTADLDSIELKCEKYGIPKPVNFAYPGCVTDSVAAEILIKKGYVWARTCNEKTWNPAADNPMLIPGFPCQGEDTAKIFNYIRQAKKGEVVVLLFHGVPDNVHPWVNLKPELLELFFRYLHDNGYTVVALRDVLKWK